MESTSRPKTCLVIPSNREAHCREFFEAWRGVGGWDFAILIEDNPGYTHAMGSDWDNNFINEHWCWESIVKHLGDDAWIISHRSDAIRCFGFLRAWQLGFDRVLTLDDDCLPDLPPAAYERVSFTNRHLMAMSNHPRWESTVPGLKVRGLPEYLSNESSVANVGLWTGVPDLPAHGQIKDPLMNFRPVGSAVGSSRLLPNGVYAPFCGMNLMISRQALPLFYFPLMGEGQPYHRFGDIWAGVIAKKICDHLRWNVSVGKPFVRHVRASDPHKNLELEAPGVEANEWFWQDIDAISLCHGFKPLETVRQLGKAICAHHRAGDYYRGGMYNAYMGKLGEALQVWAGLFDKFAPEASSIQTVGATV